MKAPDRTWCGALLLGFLLGSLHFASFSMPVMSMPPRQTLEVSWNGLDAIGYLNGWQICKYFSKTSGNVLIYSGFANPAFWLGVILLALGRWWGATFAGCVALSLAVAGFFLVCNLGAHGRSVSNVLEHYREMARLPAVQKRPADFKAWMMDAELAARDLEVALRKNAREKTSKYDAVEMAHQRSRQACALCHAKYRDVPSPATK